MKNNFYSLLFLLIFSFGASAQTEQQLDFKALDEYYTQMVKDWDIPSASIGIVKDGE
ncbi:MAG: hypothetical protein JKY48_05210, partial [Flavobacteriales bacterium]|nr:hypothetical protein [Flavobacteriales bacterium]